MNSPSKEQRIEINVHDYTWARRTRHAFRLLVATALLLTGALWFSEGYLRYDRSETQYRMTRTLHPAQARPILRTVVRREREQSDTPPSRYLEALALVEEPDHVLPTYEQAYAVNPRNAFLSINYGCALYQAGQYEESRERFREAGANPPRNALPRYLEAAALAAGMTATDDLSDLVALLTRANASGDPVLFPEPLWHESLPTGGRRHTELRRAIAQRITTPLLACANMIFARATERIAEGGHLEWDNWLANVQTMGARLMGAQEYDSQPTMLQIIAALEIQLEAARLRSVIAELSSGEASANENTISRIESALIEAVEFERQFDRLVALQEERLFKPIRLLAESFLLFFAVYSIGWLLHWAGSGGKSARAMLHTRHGKLVVALGLGLMLGTLISLWVAHGAPALMAWEEHAPSIWRVITALLLVFGLLYPKIMVRAATMAQNDRPDAERNDAPRTPLSRYVGVYGCLLQRYMGVVCGGLIIVTCLWIILCYIVFSAHPFQMELIRTGLIDEIEAVIAGIQQHLSG